MSYPTFIITQQANTRITASTMEGGLRLDISSFRLGSGVTAPSVFDTGLSGSLVYTGPVSSYFFYDENTVGIRLEVPADVGPFQFGEIALFSSDGMMVARASFETLQTKFGPSSGGMPSIWRITALLRVSQAPSVFVINTSLSSSLLELPGFQLLSAPGFMPTGQNAVIVHEPNPSGNSVLVYAHNPSHWSIVGYRRIGFITLSADSSPGTIPSAGWASLQIAGYQPSQYLVQTEGGDIRGVFSVSSNSAVPVGDMPVLPAGSVLEVYGFTEGGDLTRNVPVAEFNSLVTQFNQYWAAPSGTNVYDSRGLNQSPVPQSLSSSAAPGDWYVFCDAVMDYATLLGKRPSIDLRSLASEWNADYFSQLRRYVTMLSSLENIFTSKLGDVPSSSIDVQTLPEVTHAGAWDSLSYDVSVAFPSVDAMRGFFNSGGWLGFRLSVVPDNYVQTLHAKLLASLGTIALRGGLSESLGSTKVQWVDGDGVQTSGGNCGFVGVTGATKTLWSHSVIAASATGMDAIDGVITYSLQASVSGATLMLSFNITDTSSTEFITDSKGGSPSISIRAQTGRASPGILSSPVVGHPTVTTLPSSVW